MASSPDDHLPSESIMLEAVSEDGSTAFGARICRYPSAGLAWIWVHALVAGRFYSFNSNEEAFESASESTPVDGIVSFQRDAARFWTERRVDGSDRLAASLDVAVPAHRDPHAPQTDGAVELRIRASFLSDADPGSTRQGRLEALGTVDAAMEVDGRRASVYALGHWHQQIQGHPRFRQAFTYASLRGREASAVAVVRGSDAAGFWDSGGQRRAIVSASFGPVGANRVIEFGLDDGSKVRGSADVLCTYSVPIYVVRRPGSLVRATLGGAELTGSINDYDPSRTICFPNAAGVV